MKLQTICLQGLVQVACRHFIKKMYRLWPDVSIGLCGLHHVRSASMDAERTTTEVIQILGNDCDHCFEELKAVVDAGERDESGMIDADYEYKARQYIRAVFAFIEATTFSVKAASAMRCIENGIDIKPQERYFAIDTEYELNERGEVVETIAKISRAKNIRFALALNRRAHNVAEPFNASVEWWSCLKGAIKIRDRLTHPKWPSDLDISGDDLLKVVTAKSGFEKELLSFGDSNTN